MVLRLKRQLAVPLLIGTCLRAFIPYWSLVYILYATRCHGWTSLPVSLRSNSNTKCVRPNPFTSRFHFVGSRPFALATKVSTARTTLLYAKKKQKSATDKTSGGGAGFGAKSTTTATKSSSTSKQKKRDDDYAVFPRLETNVLETIVPSPPEGLMLSSNTPENHAKDEIYQRLLQIYGFPDFNYISKSGTHQTVVEEEHENDSTSPPPSVADILSTTRSTSSVNTARNPLALDSSGSVTATAIPGMFKDNLLSTKATARSSTGSAELDDLLAAATSTTGTTSTSSTKSSSSILSNPSTGSNMDASDADAENEDLDDALGKLPPFDDIHVLHIDPLVLSIDNFFTQEECDRYVAFADDANNKKKKNHNDILQSRSPTVGKDADSVAQRTSTTWYHHYKNVPELMSKACRLLGLSTLHRWEEPQIVRYRPQEHFTWHLDALGPTENKPELGGQRVATLLVYLAELPYGQGGATLFRDLIQTAGSSSSIDGDDETENRLRVQPKKGSALLFFPAAGGISNVPLDIRTLHCGEMVKQQYNNDDGSIATNDKWIAQLWLRQYPYQPTAPKGNSKSDATNAIVDYCSARD